MSASARKPGPGREHCVYYLAFVELASIRLWLRLNESASSYLRRDAAMKSTNSRTRGGTGWPG